MQGSQEVTDSIIKVDWKKLKEAAKSGVKVPAKEVIQVFDIAGKRVGNLKEHQIGFLLYNDGTITKQLRK